MMVSIEKVYEWHSCAAEVEVPNLCAGGPPHSDKCRNPVMKVDVKGCLHEPRFFVACAEMLKELRTRLRDNRTRKQFEQFVRRYPVFLIIRNDEGLKERWTSIVLEEVEAIPAAIDWLEQTIVDGPIAVLDRRAA